MQLSSSITTFIMHFGEMGSRWGINRTVGQIYALCVTAHTALTAEQIAEALSISRGNVSMGLKELQAWRLVKVQHKPGDRKEYYLAMGDVWDMALRVLEERRKREVEPTLGVLRDLLLNSAEVKTESAENAKELALDENHALQKMREIHDLLEATSAWSEELQKLSPSKLKTLMALGSGVTKLLGKKRKLES